MENIYFVLLVSDLLRGKVKACPYVYSIPLVGVKTEEPQEEFQCILLSYIVCGYQIRGKNQWVGRQSLY